MATLTWSEEAIKDIEGIYDYIARDSPLYAKFQTDSIIKSLERLRLFPESGRLLPEFPHLPYREVIVGNYRVIYRYALGNNEVKVISIVHASRLLREALFQIKSYSDTFCSCKKT